MKTTCIILAALFFGASSVALYNHLTQTNPNLTEYLADENGEPMFVIKAEPIKQ